MKNGEFFIQLSMKMETIEGSETSAFRTKTPGNYPKENILHNEHGEGLKSRTFTESTTSKRETSKFHASPYCNRRIFQYSRKVNPDSIHFILGLHELSPRKMQRYFLSQYIYSARELEYLQFYTPRTYFVSWLV
jgi:hypothetical protein